MTPNIKHFYYYPDSYFSEQDFWWLVGLLEGEGSFMPGNKHRPNSPRMSLGMTDEDTIAKAAKIIGVTYRGRKPSSGRKHLYYFDIKGKRTAELMTRILPHMSKRRQKRIRESLKTYKPREYPRGELHPLSVMNKQDVVDIKCRLFMGEMPSDICKDYNVGNHIISNIRTGRTWKHIKIPFFKKLILMVKKKAKTMCARRLTLLFL